VTLGRIRALAVIHRAAAPSCGTELQQIEELPIDVVQRFDMLSAHAIILREAAKSFNCVLNSIATMTVCGTDLPRVE
jgi:hypothetical protein